MVLKEKERSVIEDLQNQEKAVWKSTQSMPALQKIRN